jgi:hypothetical protein
VDSTRRKLLKTGAAATVIGAAPRALAEQAGRGAGMSFYETPRPCCERYSPKYSQHRLIRRLSLFHCLANDSHAILAPCERNVRDRVD